MLRRIALGMGILTLSFGLFTGCSDSSVTGPSTTSSTTSTDPYSYSKADMSEFTDFSEIPTTDDVFGPLYSLVGDDSTHRHPRGDRDSLGRHPDGDRDSLGRGPRDPRGPGKGDRRDKPNKRDFGRKGPGSFGDIVKLLNLTPEQEASFRECLAAFRTCDSSVTVPYRQARVAAYEDMKDALSDIRAQVEAGTLTKEEARPLIQEIISEYRTAAGDLLSRYNAALAECKTTLNSCVEGILDADQFAIWQRLHR